MRGLIFLLSIMLASCGGAAAPERDWERTYSPYGKWKSDLGFTIEIVRGKKYEVCDGAMCASGDYIDFGDHVRLVNFRNLPSTRRLQEEADVIGTCDDNSCLPPGFKPDPADTYSWRDDINFYHNVANVDHRRQCGGDRDCIILGNVETAEGMFYKVE